MCVPLFLVKLPLFPLLIVYMIWLLLCQMLQLFFSLNFFIVQITVCGDGRILICGFLIESLRVYPLCYNQVGFPGLNCFKF